MNCAITAIQVRNRKRDLGDTSQLAASIQEIGLLNPITIDQDGALIAGYHRLEACKSLGWVDIPVQVLNVDQLHAELAEIDENLVRTELHYTDRDVYIARRKEIYETLHPETTAVMGNSAARRLNETISFSEDTAAKTNQSRRNVELSVQRAQTFNDEDRDVLKRAAIPQTDSSGCICFDGYRMTSGR